MEPAIPSSSGVGPLLRSRRPVRITVTVPSHVHEALVRRCDAEGRSLSNLAAFLIEATLASAPSPAAADPSPVQAGRDPVPDRRGHMSPLA